MLLIFIVAVLCAHISCSNSNQLNDHSSNRNARGVQIDRELNSEFRGHIPIPSAFGPPNRNRRHPQMSGNNGNPPCRKKRPNVKNAQMTRLCPDNICTATCPTGYEFPNGASKVKMECKGNEWIFEGFGRNDKVECKPKSSCPSKPDTKQANANCRGSECTVDCYEGHSFEDGSTSMKLICKNEKWEPAEPNVSFPPHCESNCDSGRVFKECSRKNERTCDNPEPVEEYSEDECIQGCFCPDGTVDHQGNCIPPQNCPKEKENSENSAEPAPSKPTSSKPAPTNPSMRPTPTKPASMRPTSTSSPTRTPPRTPVRPSTNPAMPIPMNRPTVNGQTFYGLPFNGMPFNVPRFDNPPPVETENIDPNECKNGNKYCVPEPIEPDPARCEVFGDPHYLTFDGKRFDFMGKFPHYLMKMDSGMNIIAENGDCPRGFSPEVSCLKSLTMQILPGYNGNDNTKTVCLRQGGIVEVNGRDRTHELPMNLMTDYMHIRKIGRRAVMTTFGNGMNIVYDGSSYAYIDVPGSQFNRTAGLCGNFDKNPENDLRGPDGKLEQLPEALGYEWRVKDNNQNPEKKDYVQNPCETSANKHQAAAVCSQLMSPVFATCNVDPQPYIENCMYDLCASKGDPTQSMCTIFSAFANECSRNGRPIMWRQAFRQCAIQCEADQIYEECSTESFRSCADLQRNERKQMKNCIAGCRCRPGMAIDENNRCIPIDRCPCMNGGQMFRPGYHRETHQRNPPRLQRCTCKDARWDCKIYDENNRPTAQSGTTEKETVTTEMESETTEIAETTEPITESTERDVEPTEQIEQSTELVQSTEKPTEKDTEDDEFTPAEEEVCLNDERKRVHSCLPVKPKTCENMNSYVKDMVGKCKKGCVCKDEYVFDEASNSCVEPSKCSSSSTCENEGKKHPIGDQIRKDCDDCICVNAEWFCTRRKCDGQTDHNTNPRNSSLDKRETSEAQTKPCQPTPYEGNTVGLIKYTHPFRCENKEPIRGLNVCQGLCGTGTLLDPQTLQQQCACCTVTEYEEDRIKVSVSCENGETIETSIPTAKSCACQSCSGHDERQSKIRNPFTLRLANINSNRHREIPVEPQRVSVFRVYGF